MAARLEEESRQAKDEREAMMPKADNLRRQTNGMGEIAVGIVVSTVSALAAAVFFAWLGDWE